MPNTEEQQPGIQLQDEYLIRVLRGELAESQQKVINLLTLANQQAAEIEALKKEKADGATE